MVAGMNALGNNNREFPIRQDTPIVRMLVCSMKLSTTSGRNARMLRRISPQVIQREFDGLQSRTSRRA